MIVTRFAPSPTGYLHVGGARTALFCWLMARRHKGRFILRIEDTDQKRNTPTATQQVIDDLRWLGLDWDEGPDPENPAHSVGPHGPYLQSQRRDIYDKYLQQLLDAGKAYYCFDTPQELQVLRGKAQAEKRTFLYPRPQNYPDALDVEKARAEGRPVAVRFAMLAESIVVTDVVRGVVTFPAGEFGDFIIRKSDGFPTYHFACVVDDELMGVTHVIRGQEHLMNTPLHMALQQALGFTAPTYAHMSVTVSESGGKLSKRERAKKLRQDYQENPSLFFSEIPDTAPEEFVKFIDENELPKNIDLIDVWIRELECDLALEDYRSSDERADFLRQYSFEQSDLHLSDITGTPQEDIKAFWKEEINLDPDTISKVSSVSNIPLPEINVIDFLRSGYLPEALVNFLALLGWNPGDNREIMPRSEIIDAFDLDRLIQSNSLFDRQKLIAFNTEHMRLVEPIKLLDHFKNYLRANDSPMARAENTVLAQILKACAGARTFVDVENKCKFLFIENVEFDPQAVKKVLKKEGAADLLAQSRTALDNLHHWNEESIHLAIEKLCEINNVGMGKIAQPLRVAITGATISPGIADSLVLLGKERTLKRINDTLSFLRKQEA